MGSDGLAAGQTKCILLALPKRVSIEGRRDTSTLAFDIVEQATGQVDRDEGKNKAATTEGAGEDRVHRYVIRATCNPSDT